MLFFVKNLNREKWEAVMPRLLKVIILITTVIFNFKIAFGLKIGLDSGHSIKELYKSGGGVQCYQIG